MAAADFSTSSAVVDQFETEMRIACSPFHSVPLSQQMPSSCTRSIVARVRGSQYKRRPPVIAKLSNRTIDREFRYPRDWGR